MAAPEKDKVKDMMYLSIYRRDCDVLVAACDSEVIGRSFREGAVKIDVSAGFYGDQLMPVAELRKVLSTATIANLTGNRVVSHAVKEGFIDEECVLQISGVKHAQLILV
jgi:uncharacterized protein